LIIKVKLVKCDILLTIFIERVSTMKKILFATLVILQIPMYGSIENICYEQRLWQTWSGNECFPTKLFYPKTADEVKEIIRDALQKKVPVRFIGTGHSINELVCTEGYLVNTDNFDKILEVNPKLGLVRVEGGIKLKTLYKILAKEYGLALLNQGFIKEQSIAGALATGTHGTGKTGTMADFIVSIELIDGQGNYHVISRNSNPEWLEAARLHLGTLGFVYAVTLQCVPLFVMEHERTMKPWKEVLEHFDEYYKSNDYFMLMAHPITNNVLVYTWNATTEQPTNNFFIRLKEHLLTNEITNYLTIKMAHIAPGLTNDFIDLFFDAMEQKKHREYSYKTLSPIKDPHEVKDYIEEEIAIPIHHFKSAIQDIFDLYKKYEHKDFELVGFMTCRFVKGSKKALLSPAYNQDCAYISLITMNCFTKVKEFYQEYETLMSQYAIARPHWGKYNTLTKEKVANLYGDNLKKFNDVRAILDPHNIFANNYTNERLG